MTHSGDDFEKGKFGHGLRLGCHDNDDTLTLTCATLMTIIMLFYRGDDFDKGRAAQLTGLLKLRLGFF
jgi:hypothetical protein